MANGGSKMYYPPRDVYRAPKTPSQMLDSQTWKIIDLRYCVFVAGFCIFAFGYALLFHLFQLPCGSYGGFLCHCPPDCRGKCKLIGSDATLRALVTFRNFDRVNFMLDFLI